MIKQTQLSNEKLRKYIFLEEMYDDSYFPDFLVDKAKDILLNLCLDIEKQVPKNLAELYLLTQAATEKINILENEFHENESEIETAARECFGDNFDDIAQAYGFEADREELIANRDW